ncbi:MAG: hypothetical protein ACKOXZ_02410, partial [Polynucleobacter victoriensis]
HRVERHRADAKIADVDHRLIAPELFAASRGADPVIGSLDGFNTTKGGTKAYANAGNVDAGYGKSNLYKNTLVFSVLKAF